jgi:uncharacterized protein
MERFEFIRLDAERAQRTREGWIRDRPVLTRAGVFVYRNPDGTVRREFRPPDEVFKADHLASMQGVPITTAENHNRMLKADEDGVVIGAVCSAGQRLDGNSLDVVGDVVIHHPSKLGTRRELSLGYSIGRLDETPGEWNGQRYDAVQRDLTVNHCAVVARGRAGNARLRLDADDAVAGDIDNLELVRSDTSMPDVVQPFGVAVRLDNGLEYRASPEVSVAIEGLRTQNAQLRTDATNATAQRDALAAERDSLKNKLTEMEANLPKLRTDAIAEAKARLALEATAQKHGVEVRADMADRAIMEAVTLKLRPNSRFDGVSDDYVRAAFNFAIDDAAKTDQAVAQQRMAVSGVRSDAAASHNPQPAPNAVRSAKDVRELAFRAGAF